MLLLPNRKKMGQLPLAMAAAIKRDLRAFQTKPSKWLFDIVVCNRHCVHVFFFKHFKIQLLCRTQIG